MNSANVRLLFLLIFLVFTSVDANAFWWLLRGGAAGRATVSGAARTAATGALEAESAIAAGTRVCVRPIGAAACDFRIANTRIEAVSGAVGRGYRVRPTERPTVFQVLDAANNVVSIIEATSSDDDQSIADLPQYQSKFNQQSSYEYQAAPISVAPLRHDGAVLNVRVNGRATEVWSDGHVEVWADSHANRVVLAPGQRLKFPNHGTIYAIPRSSDAYTLFSQQVAASQERRRSTDLSPENCPSGFRMINGVWVCMDQR
jgi:hypothetical protein